MKASERIQETKQILDCMMPIGSPLSSVHIDCLISIMDGYDRYLKSHPGEKVGKFTWVRE